MMSLITIIQGILLILLVGYAFYYILETWRTRKYEPRIWRLKKKERSLSGALIRAVAKYKDPLRFFGWWLQYQSLSHKEPNACFAELGVYKGESAQLIHLMDPSRKFHLFDTFEGFREEDLEQETGKASTYTVHHFADTSLEYVRKKLSDAEFIFHAGNFSDTCSEVANERFVLVNMDVDLYLPTLDGLNFFFPRMIEGGMIFIHDHNPDWPGIIKAVEEFTAEVVCVKVQLADPDDTLIIIKS